MKSSMKVSRTSPPAMLKGNEADKAKQAFARGHQFCESICEPSSRQRILRCGTGGGGSIIMVKVLGLQSSDYRHHRVRQSSELQMLRMWSWQARLEDAFAQGGRSCPHWKAT